MKRKWWRVRPREVRAGTVLQPDAGFTCMKAGTAKVVARDRHGLFVPCRCGKHYLDGQLSARGAWYVGLIRASYPAESI